jgi:2-dehydro-3-deoxyglucarate aldolase/4-hydroxy-2-oxoheptanedioate aldolase
VKDNPVKRTLAGGGVALGTMVFEFNSSGIARAAAAAGAEFAIFDMEHSGWSIETVRTLIATAGGSGLVPMVRVPATQYHLIARPLDVGAMGIMVPNVETLEQAQIVVRSARYPPVGARGAGFGLAHDDYQGADPLATMQQSNNELLLIAQIESVRGVENVERIAALDGIDVLWVGHFDLTNSMGIPTQFTHPDYLRAVERVIAACNQHGKAAGIMAASVASATQALEQGFRILAYWGDVWIYQEGLRAGLNGIRAHLKHDA